MSFDDPSKLERELRALFEKEAPPQAKEMVKLDAAKVGGVSVHVVTPPPGAIPPEAAKVFGDGAKVGVTFAPKGVLVAFGPDPVAALKSVIAAGPKPARVFDLAVNPNRVRKLVAAAQGEEPAAQAEKFLGAADGLFSVLFFAIEGGDELRVQLGFNLKLLGPAAARGASLAGGGSPAPAVAGEK